MTTIYFVRHVQAMGNINHTFQGAIDTDISPQGEIQCGNLTDYFENISLDGVYCSPLHRAVLTAKAVSCGKVPVVPVDGLREICAGVWEGMCIDDLGRDYPRELEVWQNHPWDFQIEGSESMSEVFDRTGEALKQIVEDSKGKTVAVVSHGCAMRALLAHAKGLKLTDLGQVGWIKNGGITKMVFQDDALPGKAEFENYIDHLDPDTLIRGGGLYKRGEKQ